MCTFENEQSIVVCDIAIGKVREATRQAFGDAVQFTPVTRSLKPHKLPTRY